MPSTVVSRKKLISNMSSCWDDESFYYLCRFFEVTIGASIGFVVLLCFLLNLLIALITLFGAIKEHYQWFLLNQSIFEMIFLVALQFSSYDYRYISIDLCLPKQSFYYEEAQLYDKNIFVQNVCAKGCPVFCVFLSIQGDPN